MSRIALIARSGLATAWTCVQLVAGRDQPPGRPDMTRIPGDAASVSSG